MLTRKQIMYKKYAYIHKHKHIQYNKIISLNMKNENKKRKNTIILI